MRKSDIKLRVAYDLLLQMLGVTRSSRIVGLSKASILGKLREAVREYFEYYAPLPHQSRPRDGLENIASQCDTVLTSDLGYGNRRLCDEFPIRNKIKGGYSRNPLKPLKRNDVADAALATVTYMARAHSHFFSKDTINDFNAARHALNDLHQANHLAWRLYRTLPFSHLESTDPNAASYLSAVLRSTSLTLKNSKISIPAYFVWSSLLLCEIIRGNIYRRLGYLEQADRHYRHAQKRLLHLNDHSRKSQHSKKGRRLDSPSMARHFMTRTFIRALYERSKLRFDLGYFLESLIEQLYCIRCLIALHRSESNAQFQEVKRLTAKLERICTYIDSERGLPVFERARIHRFFGNTVYRACTKIPDRHVLTKKDIMTLAQCVPPDMRNFLIRLMARIGFTLFTLRPKQRGLEAIDQDWINYYFRADRLWRDDGAPDIQPSALGQYCETLFGANEIDSDIFSNSVDRKFSMILRSSYQSAPSAKDWKASRLRESKKRCDSEITFYESLLQKTTENIGNIVTIPQRNHNILVRRGYKHRVTRGDIGKKRRGKLEHINKLVVLRRWQSYIPRIPRRGTRHLPGGGCLLFWKGRGVAIDPGYDFLQNLYDEGFSLEDIDAVVVTHSHPDHDDDLSTLTTLIKEWNEHHHEVGARERVKDLDIFLNESSERKFSAWLQASKVRIGRVIPLPLVCWNRDTERPTDGPFRGPNAQMDLRPGARAKRYGAEGYEFILETVPAWHDDVIGSTSSVGLKFHLFDNNRKIGIVGYTGDTGAYGLDVERKVEKKNVLRIDRLYRDCDVIVAHLGDVRIRELASLLQLKERAVDEGQQKNPLTSLVRGWLDNLPQRDGVETADILNGEAVRERLKELFRFMIALKLLPSSALKAKLPGEQGRPGIRVQEWLGFYFKESDDCADLPQLKEGSDKRVMERLFEMYLVECQPQSESVIAILKERLIASYEKASHYKLEAEDRTAFLLLQFLAICGEYPWQYPYHLGVFGIYRLYEAIALHRAKRRSRNDAIFVIGELPEELSSYRHRVAYLLDRAGDCLTDRGKKTKIRTFTGDIGLHIRLHSRSGQLRPLVRCTYCNYNNELVTMNQNYHPPRDIIETQMSRQAGAMVYLCKNHYPSKVDPMSGMTLPEFFLNRVDLRVV